jgi:uncharacterized membrane protein
MLAGLGLRLVNLGEKSLWSDEICTIATALGNLIDTNAVTNFDPAQPVPAGEYLAKAATSHGLGAFDQTMAVLRQNIHPPLFFWLMNLSIHTLGSDPVSLRLLAVGLGVACIPMLFLVGRHLGGPAVGLLAAALYAFSGYQVAHAQDARQYTLVTLLALSSAWLMLRLMSQPDRPGRWLHWLGLTLFSALGLYSQYLYGLFIVCLYGYGLWQRGRMPGFRTATLLSGLGIALLFAPWGPMLGDQLQFLKAEGHYTSGLWKPLRLPEILWRTITDFMMPQFFAGKVLLGVLLGTLAAGLWLRRGNAAPSERSLRPALEFALVWMVGIFAAQLCLDIVKDSHTLSIRRYTLLAAPAVYLLVACAVVQLKQWARWAPPLATAALLLAMGVNSWQVVQGDTFRSDDFRQTAMAINRAYQPGDVVLVNRSGAIAVGMAYYLAPTTRMLGLSMSQPDPTLTTALSKATQGTRRIWTVYSHTGQAMTEAVREQLSQQGFSLTLETRYPGVRLMRFEKR